MEHLFHWFLNSEEYFLQAVDHYGLWIYAILFLVIFCETGLIVAPFLPGDGLLFSAGVVAATGALDIWTLLFVLTLAAILGNGANYYIGKKAGVLLIRNARLVKQRHLDQANNFYSRHGGKALILGRFMPVIRTFAPFVAGMGQMDYRQFNFYNIAGAIIWVIPLTVAGYWFGELPWIKDNFMLVYLGLVVLTLVPLLWGFVKFWMKNLIK